MLHSPTAPGRPSQMSYRGRDIAPARAAAPSGLSLLVHGRTLLLHGRTPAALRSARWASLVALVWVAGLCGACVSPPGAYTTTEFAPLEDTPRPALRSGIERGRPSPILDGLNHYLLSLPAKILFLNPRLYNHALPEDAEQILEAYLELNGLDQNVLIRHNQWAPLDEWRRLRANTEVSAFYRYTIGLYYLGYYTLLPPRLFGGSFLSLGDRFSPYTNSISIYTSDLAFLLHEGAHSKDYSEVRYKGTWGLWLELPPGALLAEYYASADAVRFVHCLGRDDLERSFYRRLIPAYGSYIGGYASYLVPGGQLVVAAGIGVGHVVGQIQAGTRWIASKLRGASEDEAPPVSEVCRPALRALPPEAPEQAPENAPTESGGRTTPTPLRPSPSSERAPAIEATLGA